MPSISSDYPCLTKLPTLIAKYRSEHLAHLAHLVASECLGYQVDLERTLELGSWNLEFGFISEVGCPLTNT